ncbi:MAG: hypothetical protein OEV09_07570 [Deltaproteobacteria bacterium]|nr:hypothetical protein [Deltaproteobacteria bacterium]MDH3850899.1 hypothetical protein [Deltaproteobacteria bacterium]MDH3930011.1 hypothetical protein [Deltaproteobacteria bacterium]
MSTEKNNNLFREDEIVIMSHVDKKTGEVNTRPYPKVGGRLRLAHEENGSLSISTEIIRYEENVAVVRALATTKKGYFNGLGMASLERDQQIAPAILELAETRAIARSLRFAGYGVEYCSAEEVSHLENGGLIERTGGSESHVQEHKDRGSEKPAKEGENDGQNSQDARLTSKQLNYLKRLARDRRMTDKELRKITMETYKKQPEYLTKKEASELIDQLLTQEAV